MTVCIYVNMLYIYIYAYQHILVYMYVCIPVNMRWSLSTRIKYKNVRISTSCIKYKHEVYEVTWLIAVYSTLNPAVKERFLPVFLVRPPEACVQIDLQDCSDEVLVWTRFV